ncbi:hypothetical protein AKJ40_01650 [candidate division MSBL1 archaeon SCGC-AAA259M10]|uniref:Uncharacterized protein n=1 Tax=candidate division MSBL1 archaeon SCGC-AAA259M10 TaxID=1698270 RepID=A0A133V1F8_9EURY|nr:hypothetical protein AKJ40_01650 [candidate division MSBL1 archaeon SCGC-AAA259M10]
MPSENTEIDDNARKVAARLQGLKVRRGVIIRDEYGLSDEDLTEALDSASDEALEAIDELWITDEPSEEFLAVLGEKRDEAYDLRTSFLRKTKWIQILIRWARTSSPWDDTYLRLCIPAILRDLRGKRIEKLQRGEVINV